MNTNVLARRLGALALTLAATLPASARAQDLPAAQDLIDRYVEAIGGREAATAAIATRTTGSFNMPAMGVSGQLEVVNGADGAMATKVTIPGMGEMLSGFTGEVGWSMDPMTGPRLLEGMELEAMREQSERLYAVRDASLFSSFETVGENEYEGQPCWEVRYVWNSGRESTECYAKDSGLLVAIATTQETPMGDVEVLSLLSGYEQFGDLFMPTSMTQRMMGQEQVMTIDDVEFGAVDLTLLQPPAAIQTLIGAGG